MRQGALVINPSSTTGKTSTKISPDHSPPVYKMMTDLVGLHKGEVGILVGNGISAEFYDLEKMRAAGCVLVGCNGSFTRDPIDYLVWQDNSQTPECVKFPGIKVTGYKRKKNEKFLTVLDSTHFFTFGDPDKLPNNLSYGNSGYLALQFLVKLGCDPILMVGCDCRVFKIGHHWRANRFNNRVQERVKRVRTNILKKMGKRYSTGSLMSFARKFNGLYEKYKERVTIRQLGPHHMTNIPDVDYPEFWTQWHPEMRKDRCRII